MSRFRVPEVATTRVMAETITTLFGFGGLAGLSLVLGAESDENRGILLTICIGALLAALVFGIWGSHWPRQAFHLPVVTATALIAVAVVFCPDPVTALGAATLIAFVVLDAHLFFASPQAFAHLVFALGSVDAALLSNDVRIGTVIGLDLMLIGLGQVAHTLVMRASDASRDPLTRLRNRRGFDNALAECMEAARTGEPLAAALLDLDHFKAINDTAGHEAGDRMLCRVADAWKAELPYGAVLARHGGDEFSLILPRMTGDEALALVRRVCAMHPDIPLSCGVAAHHPGETASQLMRRADRALYEAKAAGRGRVELDGATPLETATPHAR
ncbi:GGDEF domain-containing protein [Blastococcus aggregatus]|uniref:GGDEF domain-containing protein n=1 Tax=Blastococcus aggregatus TaxID=38502 RepID=UPI0011425D07|nr:GGDEF domain-containing protein [Blastococcus aggregatus]